MPGACISPRWALTGSVSSMAAIPAVLARSGLWSHVGCSIWSDGLLVTCHLGQHVVEVSADGHTGRRFRRSPNGQGLQDPNASVSDGEGGAFFSDSGEFSLQASATGRVYHLSAMGLMTEVLGGIRYANGVNFDAASRTLYVSEHLGRRVLALTLDRRQRVTARRVFVDFAQHAATREYTYPLGRAGRHRTPWRTCSSRRIWRGACASVQSGRPAHEHLEGVDAVRRHRGLGWRRQPLCGRLVPEHSAAVRGRRGALWSDGMAAATMNGRCIDPDRWSMRFTARTGV